MLLSHLGRTDEAEAVEGAVGFVLAAGIKTPDLGGNSSTEEVGEAVIKRLS